MMKINIVELNENFIEKYEVKKFIFKMIKDSYNLDYVPEYHYDIMDMYKYYLKPRRNNFYLALSDDDELIATVGIRGYDKDYHIKNRHYSKNHTASIYRLFVKDEYRHKKIASRMISTIEQFCSQKGYDEIYLHTQKNSYGALAFWLKQNYVIVEDTNNSLGTVHMEKILKNDMFKKTAKQASEIESIE